MAAILAAGYAFHLLVEALAVVLVPLGIGRSAIVAALRLLKYARRPRPAVGVAGQVIARAASVYQASYLVAAARRLSVGLEDEEGVRALRAERRYLRDTATADFVTLSVSVFRAADRHLNPDRWLLADESTIDLSLFTDHVDAREWMLPRLEVLHAAVLAAHASGMNTEAWQLCEASLPLSRLVKNPGLCIATHEIAVLSAARCGAGPWARTLSGLGSAYHMAGELELAEATLLHAEPLWVEAEHQLGQASLDEALGLLALAQGDPGLAEVRFLRALTRFPEINRIRGIWLIKRRLGETSLAGGQPEKAIAYLSEVRQWFADHGDHYQELRVSLSLARAHAGVGDREAVRRVLSDAEQYAVELGAPAHEQEVRDLAVSLLSG